MPSVFTSHTLLICLIRIKKFFYFVVEFEYFAWIVLKQHCTITNCISQYLQNFRNRTQRYFNSTRIIFYRKDRICINLTYMFTIYRSFTSRGCTLHWFTTKLELRIDDTTVEFGGHICSQLMKRSYLHKLDIYVHYL
jgi:hypothetical protein